MKKRAGCIKGGKNAQNGCEKAKDEDKCSVQTVNMETRNGVTSSGWFHQKSTTQRCVCGCLM